MVREVVVCVVEVLVIEVDAYNVVSAWVTSDK